MDASVPLPRLPLSALLALGLVGCGLDGPPEQGALAGSPTVPPPFENPLAVTGPYEGLITGARVVDGTGRPVRVADVLLQDGRIAWVGPLDPDTLEVGWTVDAEGRILAPGFIDLHAHWDLPEGPGLENFLAQGVTTIVLGQDGRSPEVGRLPRHLEQAAVLRPRINLAWMVGHNTIRMESGVGYGDPDAAGLERMAELVAEGLRAGAFGITLGLEYDPGVRAGPAELEAIARPVAARNGVVMSHMRNEDADQVEASVAELVEQGRRSGARVHVSHLKVVLGRDEAQAERILGMLAGAGGGGATADLYPYTASFTGLSILFPEWARPPHDYRAAVSQRREELAEWLRRRVESRNGPGATLFGSGPWSGRTLEEVARETGRPFEDLLIELGPSGARAAYFVMDDGVMTAFLRDPRVAVASDGGPSMPHPRGYGSFARVIRRHVVEEGHLSLEEAVRKMTGLPAAILGLDDPDRVGVPRGRIQQGFAADLVLFHPEEVRDTADFEAPARLAEGMWRVWVNGRLTWYGGEGVPGEGAGRVLLDRGGGEGQDGR